MNLTKGMISHMHEQIDHTQLRAYLIRNQALHVINNHVHLTVPILSGKKNKVVRQCYSIRVAHNSAFLYLYE